MKIALAKKLKEGKDTLTVYDEIVEEQGGVVKMKLLGSLPRYMQEIRNAKRSIKGVLTHEQQDQMFRLVEFCKDDCATENPFLLLVISAPELMCVLATQQQLSDMKKFLTEEDNCHNGSRFNV